MTEDTRAHGAPNRDPEPTEIRGRVLDNLIDDIRNGLAASIYLAKGRLPISDPVGAALMLGVIDKLDMLLQFHQRAELEAAIRRSRAEEVRATLPRGFNFGAGDLRGHPTRDELEQQYGKLDDSVFDPKENEIVTKARREQLEWLRERSAQGAVKAADDDFEGRVRAEMVFGPRPPDTAEPSLPKCDFCGSRDPICPLVGPPPECNRPVEVEGVGGGGNSIGGGGGGIWPLDPNASGGGASMGAMAGAVKESPQRRSGRERRAIDDPPPIDFAERRGGHERRKKPHNPL